MFYAANGREARLLKISESIESSFLINIGQHIVGLGESFRCSVCHCVLQSSEHNMQTDNLYKYDHIV